MNLLTLTLLLISYKIADQKDLIFLDFTNTQYAILPKKSLDYQTAKNTCTFNDAHLPQFTSFRKFSFFEMAYNESKNFNMPVIRFWISAIKLKEKYNFGNSTIWKADDGSGETLPRFHNQSLKWVDEDVEILEPKKCLTFGFPERSFVADHCSNRNDVLCMRPLTNFGIPDGYEFIDQLRYQYVLSGSDLPLTYAEAKSLCLAHRATLVSFQLLASLNWFRLRIISLLSILRDDFNGKDESDFKVWLSATRTAARYTAGDNIWNVDDGSGTVFPRLRGVTWNDSGGASVNMSADCLYYDVWKNTFQAADCSQSQWVICCKPPLVLEPYAYESNVFSQTNRTDPDTMRQVNKSTIVTNTCSGITLGTKVLSCIVAVAFVISVITSILCIRNIGKSKPANRCDKKTPKKLIISSTASKTAKRRSTTTKNAVNSPNESIFHVGN